MSRRIVSGIILFILLVGMSTLVIQLAKSSSATITVPDDYPTIQEAINNADNGDTVFVKNGTYIGNFVVNKTISLIGENRKGTIIKGVDENPDYTEIAILIEADNVTIKKFTVSNTNPIGFRFKPISLQIKSSGCLISDNNIVENIEGIILDGREPEATVEGNVITDNYISGSYDCGILVWTSCENYITCNRVENGLFAGIFLAFNASKNLIKRNRVVNNYERGIAMIVSCSYNTIIYNNITRNGFGGYYPSGVSLILQCDGNRIVSNNICDNKIGLYQDIWCNNTSVFHNNFINNTKQFSSAPDPCSADFPAILDKGYPSGGNYWSDYNGSDIYSGFNQNETGSDGIGDIPFVVDDKCKSNIDLYPLMEPYAHPLGDINYDGTVDMQDISIVARAFGSYPSHPNWNPIADVNNDGRVDLRDVALVAKDFGK